MKTLPIRKYVLLLTTVAFLLIVLGCGGVAKNPTSTNWKDQKEDREGSGGTTSEDEKEQGAPEIPAGAGYDELMATGNLSLEGGFFKTAAEAYSKAHEDKREAADAALAYVVTKLADSPDKLSILMAPGIDLFYYNTPFIGRWEFFPAPFAADDSYLLRLAALGTKYGTAGRAVNPPPTASPPPTEKETPTGTVETSEGGSEAPISGDGSDAGGGDSIGGHAGPGMGGARSTQFNRKTSQDLGNDGSGGAGPGAGGAGPGAGSGGKLEYEGQGQGQKVEYLIMNNDIMPDLLDDYKDLARTYSAGILNLNAVNTSVDSLGGLLETLIEVLEDSLQSAENDNFALELPFKLDNKNALYRVYFNNTDYLIILGYLKMLKAELIYRTAYQTTTSTDLLFNLPVDANGDRILTPSEYYPPSPYGELVDGGDEKLQEASLLLGSGLDLLVNGFDDLYNDNKLADYEGNLLIPFNIEQQLIDIIAEHRDEFSDFQVLMAAGKEKVSFKTPSNEIKADVDISHVLGEEVPISVAALLPNLDANTYEPVLTPQSNVFPDPTWGGIFYEGLDNFDIFLIRGDIKGTLTNQGEGIKDVTIAIQGGQSVKTNDKGKFTLSNVEINELVGITVTVSSPEVLIPVKAQIRNFWVNVDQQVLTNAPTSIPPVTPGGELPGGGETLEDVGSGGGTSSGTPRQGGKEMLDKIQQAIKDKQKKENEEKKGEDEGESKEPESTPSEDG